jgi:hypothetical protein
MRLQAGSWLRGYKWGRGYAATSGVAAMRLQAGSWLRGYKRGRGYAAIDSSFYLGLPGEPIP